MAFPLAGHTHLEKLIVVKISGSPPEHARHPLRCGSGKVRRDYGTIWLVHPLTSLLYVSLGVH
jgi:hypothetical protein